MKRLDCSLWVVLLVGIATNLFAQDGRLGGIQLLPGYKHQAFQGYDSLLGNISKPDGLSISYEIGRVTPPGGWPTGGSFIDHPKQQPADQIRWYREQIVNGKPVHLAYRNDNLLLVSFPTTGLNFSASVRDANEMAEALLMIMTYPGEANKPGGTTEDVGEAGSQPRNLTKANLRDIEKLADRLTSDAEALHDEYHEHLESVKHGAKLDADVSKMERIAKSLSEFSKQADGSEESILRLRADTNDLLRLSWQIARTVDLAEKSTRDADTRQGIKHVREVAADVVETTLAIDDFLAVDPSVFDSQVARMEELVKELHTGFHKHLEEYEVSNHLDEALRGLEQQVEHIHDLAHNKEWKNIDLKQVLDETNAARLTTEQIESLLLEQLEVGVRERDRACIEYSRDSISDVLAAAQLIEYMISKQKRGRAPPLEPIAKAPRVSVTNLGPGALRLDLPNGSKIVQPNASISISIGSSAINLVALDNDANVSLVHDGNGDAKFWDVDDQMHTRFSPDAGSRQFVLARDRSGYRLEQHGSNASDGWNQSGANPKQPGQLSVGTPQLKIAECSTFEQQWNDRGSGALMDGAFWRPVMSGYYPVGDLLVNNYRNPNGRYTCLVVKDGVAGATRAPVDFKRIWTSDGSKPNQEGSIWQPIPPKGYVAMGCVAQSGYDKPNAEIIRCIRKDLVTQAKLGDRRWSDQFSGANENISTYGVEGSGEALAPNTFVAFNNYYDLTKPSPGFFAFSQKATLSAITIGRDILVLKVFELFPSDDPEQSRVYFELNQVTKGFQVQSAQDIENIPQVDTQELEALKAKIADGLNSVEGLREVTSRLEKAGRVEVFDNSSKRWGGTVLVDGFVEENGNRRTLRIREKGVIGFKLPESVSFRGFVIGSFPMR